MIEGYIQRLKFLRDYYNGDKALSVVLTVPQIVELLDSIIKDLDND